MKIIGLTGGIGSGKSTVARFLAELGAVVIDLDKVGHEVLNESETRQKVVGAFGKGIQGADGEIDRAKLSDIVFKNGNALQRLNGIIHPAIDALVAKDIERYRGQSVKVLVIEAAAIIESGKAAHVEELWDTVAPEDVVLNRLRKRSGYSEKESRARIKSQLSNKERIKQADVVIDTTCTLDELKARVMVEWQKLLKRL